MQELSTNEETEWVEHLVGEMVDGAAHFRHSPDAMHILKESLALPCLREDFLEEQLAVSSCSLHCSVCLLSLSAPWQQASSKYMIHHLCKN